LNPGATRRHYEMDKVESDMPCFHKVGADKLHSATDVTQYHQRFVDRPGALELF
jgi:hypothetical protein